LRLRVGLAPLSSRDGIESTKVVGLSDVGEIIYLKPSKLRSFLDESTRTTLSNTLIEARTFADGPTRVLKFSLVQRNNNIVALDMVETQSNYPSLIMESTELLRKAAKNAIKLIRENNISIEVKEDTTDIHREKSEAQTSIDEAESQENRSIAGDSIFSIRASLSGFVFSLIDDAPTEIALISLRKVQAMAKWNRLRSTEATIVLSVGWMQIDNHCPNAPFPIFLCPDGHQNRNMDGNMDEKGKENPFLSIGLVFTPRHKSGIMCLKGVSIDPSNFAIAVDLGFVFRVQYFLLGLQEHLDRCRKNDLSGSSLIESDWGFPDLHKVFKKLIIESTSADRVERQKLYFENFYCKAFNMKLSVAPAVAMTPAQASLEGNMAAAVHAAVRKGDVLIRDGVGVLGVKIGSKNRTALAIIRGIFKSILIDGLLRCDGASMNFPGVGLRNFISTAPQLKTYLGARYLASLKSNVPAVVGSLAAFGNPVGLIRGLGLGLG